MYEKSKRNSKSQDSDPKAAKQKAIILTWSTELGHCEIQTYRISDRRRTAIML